MKMCAIEKPFMITDRHAEYVIRRAENLLRFISAEAYSPIFSFGVMHHYEAVYRMNR